MGDPAIGQGAHIAPTMGKKVGMAGKYTAMGRKRKGKHTETLEQGDTEGSCLEEEENGASGEWGCTQTPFHGGIRGNGGHGRRMGIGMYTELLE